MISSKTRRLVMKCVVARTTLVVVFSAVFALGIAPMAHAQQCSNATLYGSFGYTSTGALLPAYVAPYDNLAGPFAEVGRQTFDGRGNTKATATLTANGNVSQGVAIYGTYVVNPDCTGSMTLNVPSLGAVVHADFVVDDNGAEIRAIVTDANVIESRVYKKQFSQEGSEQ
jgi:hypothetical protein